MSNEKPEIVSEEQVVGKGGGQRMSDFVSRRTQPKNQELTLADLQVEAIRGVLVELLSSSGSASPGVWGPQLLGQLSRILDMTEPLQVMGILSEQMHERERDDAD